MRQTLCQSPLCQGRHDGSLRTLNLQNTMALLHHRRPTQWSNGFPNGNNAFDYVILLMMWQRSSKPHIICLMSLIGGGERLSKIMQSPLPERTSKLSFITILFLQMSAAEPWMRGSLCHKRTTQSKIMRIDIGRFY